MKTGSKLCLLESSRGFPKLRYHDLVFDLTCPDFRLGLDLIEINILAKFHDDCIKTVPSGVYTCFFLSFDLVT